MTNEQIIVHAKIAHKVTEEVHTYAYWQNIGFQVQKGAKALFVEGVWRAVKSKKDENKEHLIYRKAAFFGRSQVEPIL